ncbi:hypothetical protein SAMN05518863_102323 [Candidatus Pantoea symbiotica]|jgi:hypothetical protein|uniref:Lipoprotein n=1 Tax=Candidatus Pantoea symbiotica TaxID=1884370 RepID=A0A1I3TDB1_9GAMM|nr:MULTISPECIES: hypothetical protein [Pantoea]KAJ9432864.1 hypothetical protein PMI39_011185 [Pantoea sp. YR343]MRT23665.1 hypothetical protein [Enterobacteriaceae bacterium RIT697]SFJ68590.1 hypothetical protein SAMN05518863_102323 [Pantoea symbiotica]SFU50270.1 hypothetical protein SAMN05518864_102274 [Pantoea sp. YR525]
MYKPVILIAMLLSGCALKQYPQSANVSDAEAQTYDCAALNQEIAKSQSVKQQIDKTGEFDALTILGFVGDFGIGNGLAKASANNKAAARLQQLENLKAVRCEHNAT